MKTKSILAVAALLLLGVASAQAEDYDGVHPLTHSADRAQVHADAVVAAHSPDPYADGYGADLPAPFTSTVARATVRAEAVVAAHSPDPYADGADAGVPVTIASTASRSAVNAQAVATARMPRLNVWGEAF